MLDGSLLHADQQRVVSSGWRPGRKLWPGRPFSSPSAWPQSVKPRGYGGWPPSVTDRYWRLLYFFFHSSLLCFFKSIAFKIHLKNNAVMNQSIYGCRRCHWIFKNLFPLRERQIAGEHHTASLVTMGKQCKKHFHFLTALLYIANIIDKNGIILREFL